MYSDTRISPDDKGLATAAAISANAACSSALKYVIVISVLFLDTAIIIWGFQLHNILICRYEV